MALDILKMRYFSTIAELGSFTRAATALGVAQPALSLHMRTLEEQMGVKLLNRTSRGVVATEAGQTLLAHSQAILRAVEQAEQATREQAEYPTGDVVLGILSSISPTLSIPIFQECTRLFPNIRLMVSEGDSQTLRAAVESRSYDMAVNLADVAKANAMPLFEENLYVVGPPGHFPQSATMPLAEALKLPLILPSRKHGIRILLERNAILLNAELDLAWNIEGVASTKEAIRAGLGLTILGRGAIHADRQSGYLSAALISSPMLSRRLVLDMPTNHPLTRAVIEVRKILLEVIKALGQQSHWTCLP